MLTSFPACIFGANLHLINHQSRVSNKSRWIEMEGNICLRWERARERPWLLTITAQNALIADRLHRFCCMLLHTWFTINRQEKLPTWRLSVFLGLFKHIWPHLRGVVDGQVTFVPPLRLYRGQGQGHDQEADRKLHHFVHVSFSHSHNISTYVSLN